jgi:hypothetical protein
MDRRMRPDKEISKDSPWHLNLLGASPSHVGLKSSTRRSPYLFGWFPLDANPRGFKEFVEHLFGASRKG